MTVADSFLAESFGDLGYAAPFLFLVGAGAGFPCPEEVTMVASGYLLYLGWDPVARASYLTSVGVTGMVSYRLQGPSLLVEYACQNLGGDPLDHLHAMYRDPTNEYGAGFEGEDE